MRNTLKRAILFLCCLIGSVSAAKSKTEASSQPNIVLIIADDLGWADVAFNGNRDVKTPNIDALASSGLVFNNMYLTASSCSPSRASIITGRYPHNTGAPELHDPLPPNQVMFPAILKDAGYYTALSGKNHMGPSVKKAFNFISPGRGPGGEEDWVSIIQDRPADKAFFLWFASHDPHRDWQSDENGVTYDPATLTVPPMLYDGPQTRKDLAAYYHEISRLDHYVGLVVKELKRQGVFDNTYIIFMSDNGSPFPRNKVRLYDSGIKSPFIITGPGIAVSRTNSLFSSIDIAPTILDLAGLRTDKRIQGRSFSRVLRDREKAIRDFVFAERNWHVFQGYERMVRYRNWVYIRNGFPEIRNLAGESTRMFPAGKELWDAYERGLTKTVQEDVFLKPRPAEELYDLSEDPYQFSNIATAGAAENTLAFLRRVLDVWIAETGDSQPENPTPDRDDLQGKPLPGKWTKGEKPGERYMADTITSAGPVLKRDVNPKKLRKEAPRSW